ncbi:hypothetical protein ACFQ0M_04820 [Kitasatospora aburaviensis]
MNARPGVDAPDHRGRTGLDRVGRDPNRNPDVVVRDVELTSQGWHVLRRTTFDYRRRDGRWVTQQRETYDRGNGAVVLPYDTERGRVLLTRQLIGRAAPGVLPSPLLPKPVVRPSPPFSALPCHFREGLSACPEPSRLPSTVMSTSISVRSCFAGVVPSVWRPVTCCPNPTRGLRADWWRWTPIWRGVDSCSPVN